MNIYIRDNGKYKDVQIEVNGTTIDLGLQDNKECKELAKTLFEAAQELLELN